MNFSHKIVYMLT